MSVPSTIVIEILTKSDCCLCDNMKKIVASVLQDYPAILVMTDIELSPILYEKFKERIPILKINGIESFVYKANETTLRHKLDLLKNKNDNTTILC
jgi:hypothetical protein